jgi:hypothetical protein
MSTLAIAERYDRCTIEAQSPQDVARLTTHITRHTLTRLNHQQEEKYVAYARTMTTCQVLESDIRAG